MLYQRSRTGPALRGALLLLLIGACSVDVRPKPSREHARAGGRDQAQNGVVSAPAYDVTEAAGAMNAGSAGSFANPTPPAAIAGSGAAGATAAGPTSAEGACAEGSANATPITPTIWLVVDGSSSMETDFEPGVSRWDALRATLMGPAGVVASLEHVARIGLVIYSGGGLLMGECVQLITVEPAQDNFAMLDAKYPQQWIGLGTPTDLALEQVVTNLPVPNVAIPGERTSPVYVVLATDGAPNDSCGGAFGGESDANVQQAVIDVTARGAAMGMEMFVISLAGGDAALQGHLEQVAQATRSMTPPFVPANQANLVTTFLGIVGGATCQVALDGSVTAGRQCSGEVLLNGEPLACDADDGWRLRDPHTVELTGSACERFRATASQVRASFPCDVFVPE